MHDVEHAACIRKSDLTQDTWHSHQDHLGILRSHGINSFLPLIKLQHVLWQSYYIEEAGVRSSQCPRNRQVILFSLPTRAGQLTLSLSTCWGIGFSTTEIS